jgi:hypothetical protein
MAMLSKKRSQRFSRVLALVYSLGALSIFSSTNLSNAETTRVNLERMEEGIKLARKDRAARQREERNARAREREHTRKRSTHHVQHKKQPKKHVTRGPREIKRAAPRTKKQVAQSAAEARLLYHDQATYTRLLNALRILRNPHSNQFTRISTQTRILQLISQLRTKEYRTRAQRVLATYRINPATLKSSAEAHFAYRRFAQLAHRYTQRRTRFKTANITTSKDGRIAHELLSLYDTKLTGLYKTQANALLKRLGLTIEQFETVARKHPITKLTQQKSRTPAVAPKALPLSQTSLAVPATLQTATQALGAPALATAAVSNTTVIPTPVTTTGAA